MPLAAILFMAAESRTPPVLQNTTRPLSFSALVTCLVFRETLLRTLLLDTHAQTARPTMLFRCVPRNPVVTVVFMVQARFRFNGLDAPLTLCTMPILGRFGAISFYRWNLPSLLTANPFVRVSIEQSTGDTRFGLRKQWLSFLYVGPPGLHMRNLENSMPIKLVLFTVLLGRLDPVPLITDVVRTWTPLVVPPTNPTLPTATSHPHPP